jgi:WD40-like Beta Propeller Repeat
MTDQPRHVGDDLIAQVLRLRAAEPSAGLLDDIVRSARATPQRRGWWGLGTGPGQLSRRAVQVLAVVLLLAAAAVAAAVGARLLRPEPPAPALLPNGEIVAVRDGVLVAFDPVTHQARDLDLCTDCRLPSWSADGSLLAYVQGGTVVVRDMASGTVQEVATCGGACTDLALSPDGGRVAFADGIVAHVRAVAGGPEVTFAPSNVEDVAWAPAGDELLLGGRNRLHRVPIDGGDPRLLVGDADVDPRAGPIYASWSPDGDRIAYVVDAPDPSLAVPFDYQLWVMDTDGGNRRQVWNIPNCCVRAWGGPAWSPDGLQIGVVAASEGGGTYALWVVEADGSDATVVAGVSPERVAWRPRQEQ